MTRFKRALWVLVLTAMPLIYANPVFAQNARTLERLSEMNRINPLQNNDFEPSERVLNRDIQDRKNKIVGQVKDITIRQNGSIDTILVEFDRLRLSTDVPLNFRQLSIRSQGDSYALSLEDDEIEDLYPQLLANIDTASGGDDFALSAREITGIEIRTSEGRRIGEVRQILFGANGGRVDGLFVELSSGKNRGDTVAIPFRATKFNRKNGRLRGEITPQLASAILKIVD